MVVWCVGVGGGEGGTEPGAGSRSGRRQGTGCGGSNEAAARRRHGRSSARAKSCTPGHDGSWELVATALLSRGAATNPISN